MNDTIRKFGYPETLVHEYDRWVVLLRPQQVTLGALVLACKEPARQFHELSAEAFAELRVAVGDIEEVLAAQVAYRKINYLMLMMVDPDVHFHVVPRYDQPARFQDIEFPDHGWPGPPALGEFTEVTAQTSAAITDWLKGCWPRR